MNEISMVAEKFYDVLDDQLLESMKDEKFLAKIGAPTDDTIVSRKQSASDLQSRLKTRKLLGVGELAGDNGDVYKSKISQLLGINESLYVRLPRGMFVWNTVNSLYFLLIGSMCIFFPQLGLYLDHGIASIPQEAAVVIRYYGITLVAFGLLFKFILQQRETRADIALLLLVTAVFHFIVLIVTTASHGTVVWWSAGLRAILIFGNIVYHTFVDGQGGLHRQLIRVIEETSFLSSTPILEKKTAIGVVEDLVEDFETVKKNE
uniref:Tumor protein p53-inducible protein 11 n=1 Tax=Caenorhabditis tropicalis TaxID=1561998 RepID=A0A1I7U7I9_9PELO